MDRHFRPELPGNPLITIRTGTFGDASVYADGREVRAQRRGLRIYYPIPMQDGEHLMRVHTGFGALKAELDGITYELEKPLRIWEVFIALLPIGLVAVGGAVGGAVGAVAAGINIGLMRRPWPVAGRIVAAILVTAAAIVVWLLVALSIRSFL